MTRVAIIGSNDLGQLIAHHSASVSWTVAGFFDNRKPVGSQIEHYGAVIGAVDDVTESHRKGVFDLLMVGVGYTQFAFRKSVFERFKGAVPFGRLIHPSAYIDASAVVGEGAFVLPGCIVDAGVVLGNNVLLNTGAKIAHHTNIGDHSFLAPGVTVAGKVFIGECCFLGVGANIADHVTIVPETLVGGGALVVKDIPESGTYIGVPAKRAKDNAYL